MVLTHTVFKTVLSIAIVALHARVLQRVYKRLAHRMRALGGVVNRRLHSRNGGYHATRVRGPSLALPPGRRPLPGARALVRMFRAVVEAERAFARFATEREEVELVAVLEFAVFTDRV